MLLKHFPENQKNVSIPITIDALGIVRKNTKIPDLMEVRFVFKTTT